MWETKANIANAAHAQFNHKLNDKRENMHSDIKLKMTRRCKSIDWKKKDREKEEGKKNKGNKGTCFASRANAVRRWWPTFLFDIKAKNIVIRWFWIEQKLLHFMTTATICLCKTTEKSRKKKWKNVAEREKLDIFPPMRSLSMSSFSLSVM